MNKGNYNMSGSKKIKTGLMLLLCLFFKLSIAQNLSSDELLRQAITETNINKNYHKAIQLAKQALAISPKYSDIRLLLGKLYILTNQLSEADAELQRVLIQTPNQKDALNYLINLSYQENKIVKAIEYADTYLEYYPGDKKMDLKRIAMLYEAGDLILADDSWKELRKRYPNDLAVKNLYVDAYLLLAKNLRKQNETQNAIAAYQKVLAVQPDQIESLKALFNLNIQVENYERALVYASLLEKRGEADILLSKADLLLKMKRYDEAEALANNLRQKNAQDEKAIYLYKAVLYAKANDELQRQDSLNAIKSYQNILTSYPADTFSRGKLINLSVAHGQKTEAIKYINEGILHYDNPQNIELKKLSILQDQKSKKEAYQFSKSLSEKYPENEQISAINEDLFNITRQNRVGFNYVVTAFDQQGRKPWNLYSAFYMRTEEGGSLIARVNYADRKDATGYQFEVEAYPLHNSGYSYINLAYSNAMIFPRFRFAYSYFLPFNKSWEAEMGIRYLNSYLNYYSITAGLGKYLGNFWLNGKTFLTPNGKQLAASYVLSGRYLINGAADDYVTAIAGYGFSPDDRGRNFVIQERLNLESIRFTLGYQRTLWKRNLIGIFGTWNNQEFIPGSKRNEFDAQISFQHKF